MRSESKRAPWMTARWRKGMEELERLEGDESMRELYEARKMQLHILATELQDSFEEGLKKGREEALERKRQEGAAQAAHLMAKRLLDEGESAERVARLTGIPLQQLLHGSSSSMKAEQTPDAEPESQP